MSKHERIVVIFHKDEKSGKKLASHGIGEDTLKTYIVPPNTASEIGAIFDPKIGEMVLC